MKATTRTAVACIVASVIVRQNIDSVYSHDIKKFTSFSNDSTKDEIELFDYDCKCHISGELPSIFHYGDAAFIDIEVEGNDFSGFDYKSSQHFNGSLEGDTVSLFDFDGSGFHLFTVG